MTGLLDLQAPQLVALGIFTSYFLIILALFGWVARSICSAAFCTTGAKRAATTKAKACVFVLLAIGSFIHTWYYMFEFMEWSFHDYEQSVGANAGFHIKSASLLERIARWLQNTALFEQAWAVVCRKPSNWWWSEQLCLFTVGAWTVFLATEGKRRWIKHLPAYMLLGQFVAISVASNLFYAAVVLSPPAPASPAKARSAVYVQATRWLWIPVIVGLVATGLSPFTSDSTFLPNLVLMHAALFIPLLDSVESVVIKEVPNAVFSKSNPPVNNLSSVGLLYVLSMVASVLLRFQTISTVLSSEEFTNLLYEHDKVGSNMQLAWDLVRLEWKTLFEHPAQSSIGWDIIWCSASLMVWVLVREKDDSGVWTFEFGSGRESSDSEEERNAKKAEKKRNAKDETGSKGRRATGRESTVEPPASGNDASSSSNRGYIFNILYTVLATPFASIGVTGPYVLRSPEPEYVPFSEW
ncbi:hypothetical protein AX16_009457 [Volvariella volvacea WC 439]|nr:hypothetical protein AX16_009457 [Volvariella volvacea WC 439]